MNVLHQHYLGDGNALLLLCNVADVHEEILEEQSIHLLVHVARVGMCPNQDHRIFFGRGTRPEGVRRPRSDFMGTRLVGVLGSVDGIH